MPNLFDLMAEAPGDQGGQQPAQDQAAPAQDQPAAGGADAPPDIGDLAPPDMGAMGGTDQMGMGMDGMGMDPAQGGAMGQQEDPNALPLDEKGEIFAKVKLLESYKQMYQKAKDTIEMIDKIDLVQIGNNIKNDDINDIKSKMSDLMDDIYTTIVYEFQLAYGNLKVKLVEYSSRYVVLMQTLKKLIRKDQAESAE